MESEMNPENKSERVIDRKRRPFVSAEPPHFVMEYLDAPTERKRASIEKRTLAIADQFVHGNKLALTNTMDFYTFANLLRNLDDLHVKLNLLSLYRVDLDFNYAYEVLQILSRFEEVVLDDCEGTHVHLLVSGILHERNAKRLDLSSQTVNIEVDTAFEIGLTNSVLMDLSLTIEMPVGTATALARGLNRSCVEQLDLTQCEIYADAIQVLCDCFRENKILKKLNLGHCRLLDDEVGDLVRAVKNHPCLLDLSVRMNYAQVESVEAVVELLASTPALQRLDLAQQNPGDLDLNQLARGLMTNDTLRHLDLQENYLSEFDVPVLCEAFSINETLCEINLEDCDIKDSGLHKLIENFASFRGLTHLHLKQNNFFQRPNRETLEGALEENHSLVTLELDHQEWIPLEGRRWLLLNRAGRRYLQPGSLNPGLWPFVLARSHHVVESNESCDLQEADVIFELLHGPVLLER